MPPRRSHKKSRAGCRRCKSRKIKCDEVHPRCGNCLKHGVPCDFENPEIVEELLSAPTPTPLSALDTSPTPSAISSVPSSAEVRTPLLDFASPVSSVSTPLYVAPAPPTLSRSTPPANRLLELRLMHQYTSMTSRTLVITTPATDEIWQKSVPHLAFNGANYLADAMLAVAALHLRSIDPTDQAIVRASHSYMASSLAEYCASLNSGINESNAEALFLTATLIAFQSTATRIFIRDEAIPNDPSSVYSLPIPWFHAFQGVKTVVATSWQWLRNSGIVIPIIDSQPVLQLDFDTSHTADSFFGHLLENLDDEVFEEDQETGLLTRHAYYHAIAVLNWAHKLPHRGAAMAFPATVSKRFIDLLEARRPRALVILACFFALLKSFESTWWLKGMTRREIMGIVSQFQAASPWWSHLEWPVRIALFEGAVIPPDVWGADWVTEETKKQKPNSTTDTFVNHIEILAGMMAQSPTRPTGPTQTDPL